MLVHMNVHTRYLLCNSLTFKNSVLCQIRPLLFPSFENHEINARYSLEDLKTLAGSQL